MVIEILLVFVIVLLVVLLFLTLRRGSAASQLVESAFSNAWIRIGLEEKMGRLNKTAEDIQSNYRSLELMLRQPTTRGAFGELALKHILADQLPKDMYGTQKKTLDGKFPDAYIESTVGVICIDSKFPLDNYRKMMEAQELSEKSNYGSQFLKDVEGHLKKIAVDYVCPDKGSADFAFAFIPSEAVYGFLVSEAFEELRDFTKQGVQVVSPLTLSHKIELIKAGVHARKLSEEAQEVRAEITRLSKAFLEVDEAWRIFYETHLHNLSQKAKEINVAYQQLKDEFKEISQTST